MLFAVAGINCINPSAPAEETAFGFPFDSALMMALIKPSSTPYFEDASLTYAEKFFDVLAFFTVLLPAAEWLPEAASVSELESDPDSVLSDFSNSSIINWETIELNWLE
jgi:hypothetical protein